MRVAACQHHHQLFDIGFAPAEAGWQRQRYGPQAGIDRTEEACGELGTRFGDQRNPIALFEAERQETVGVTKRIFAKLGIGVGPHQRAASVVEIHPTIALGGIIERIAQRRKIGNAPFQPVEGRRIAVKRQGGVDPVVPVEHAANPVQ